MKFASKTSAEICASLTSVSDALSKSEKYDIGNVSKKAKERVCGSCGLYDACWKEKGEETYEILAPEFEVVDIEEVMIELGIL